MTSSVTFNQIDTILAPWVKERGLHFFTRYQDEEIRGIYLVDDSADVYSLGIFLHPNKPGEISLRYGRNFPRGKKFRRQGSRTAELKTLKKELSLIYEEIESWISERGHARTPVL